MYPAFSKLYLTFFYFFSEFIGTLSGEATLPVLFHPRPPQWGSTFKGKNLLHKDNILPFSHIAFRKAKIVYNFGLSECKRVKG